MSSSRIIVRARFDALGLGYEALAKINPRLIYCSMSAFGNEGPRGGQTGYDNVIQAMSGLMAMTGTAEVAVESRRAGDRLCHGHDRRLRHLQRPVSP